MFEINKNKKNKQKNKNKKIKTEKKTISTGAVSTTNVFGTNKKIYQHFLLILVF